MISYTYIELWKPYWLLGAPTGLVQIFIVNYESLVQIHFPENLYVSKFKGKQKVEGT